MQQTLQTIKILSLLLCCLWMIPAKGNELYHNDFNNKQCCLVISHALGGIHGNAYTNSLEAFIHNLNQGSLVFEADLAQTSDGTWIVTHDWQSWSSRNKYNGPNPPNLDTFLHARIQREDGHKYTPLTWNDIERILARNPDVQLILDTKYKLEDMTKSLANSKVKSQLIWQAYDFADIDFLQANHVGNIILTLYKMQIPNPASFFKYLRDNYAHKIVGLTVPLKFYFAHTKQLTSLGIPIYIHGKPDKINSRQLHLSLRDQVAGFYLD